MSIVVVIVSTKIASLDDLGTWVTHKQRNLSELAKKKLASVYFKLFGMGPWASQIVQFCPFLLATPTYWAMCLLHMCMVTSLPSMIGNGRQQTLCLYRHCTLRQQLYPSDYRSVQMLHVGYVFYRVLIILVQSCTCYLIHDMLLYIIGIVYIHACI